MRINHETFLICFCFLTSAFSKEPDLNLLSAKDPDNAFIKMVREMARHHGKHTVEIPESVKSDLQRNAGKNNRNAQYQEWLEKDIFKTLAAVNSIEQMIETKWKPLLAEFPEMPDILKKTEQKENEKPKVEVAVVPHNLRLKREVFNNPVPLNNNNNNNLPIVQSNPINPISMPNPTQPNSNQQFSPQDNNNNNNMPQNTNNNLPSQPILPSPNNNLNVTANNPSSIPNLLLNLNNPPQPILQQNTSTVNNNNNNNNLLNSINNNNNNAQPSGLPNGRVNSSTTSGNNNNNNNNFTSSLLLPLGILPTSNNNNSNSDNKNQGLSQNNQGNKLNKDMAPRFLSMMQPSDQEAKELASAPKGLVLVVQDPGQSNLKVGQTVDGNLNPINVSSNGTSTNTKKSDNKPVNTAASQNGMQNMLNNSILNDNNKNNNLNGNKAISSQSVPLGMPQQLGGQMSNNNNNNNNNNIQTTLKPNTSILNGNQASNSNLNNPITSNNNNNPANSSNNNNPNQLNNNNNSPTNLNNNQNNPPNNNMANNNLLNNNMPSNNNLPNNNNIPNNNNNMNNLPVQSQNDRNREENNKQLVQGQRVNPIFQPVGDRVAAQPVEHLANRHEEKRERKESPHSEAVALEKKELAEEQNLPHFEQVEAQPVMMDWSNPVEHERVQQEQKLPFKFI